MSDGPFNQDDAVAAPPRPGYPGEDAGWDDDDLVEPDEPWDDDDYVHVAPHRGPWRKLVIALILFLLLLALVAGAGWLWLQRRIDPPGDPGPKVAIEVPEGSTTEDIGS